MLPAFLFFTGRYRNFTKAKNKKMQNDKNNGVIFYWVDSDICFISSAVIPEGLFIAKNENGKTINQKILSNCNSGHLSISKKNKTVEVSIISGELQFTKTLK